MSTATFDLPIMPARKTTAERRAESSSRRQQQTEPEVGETPADPAGDSADAPTFTIDELAAKTAIPSRTIRFYQSSGVLPAPDKRGRVAFYGPGHIERLELIGKMQDRGLRMRAIKELVDRIDSGELALQEWLGLEEQLSSAWIDDAPRVLTRTELADLLGERRPGFIAELVRAGTLESRGEDTYLVPSPGLLQVAARLDDAGVSVEVATGASAILQRHLAKAARELASYFSEHAGDGFGHGDSVTGISEAFRELRTIGPESVRLIFAREMEQVLRRMVESGEATRIEKKHKRKRKR